MKYLKILTALSIGILASTSGMIQVGATTYNYFVDFSTKEVANFNDFKQTFNEDTYNLTLNTKFSFIGSYRFDSCPTAFVANVNYELYVRKNGVDPFVFTGTALPDFPCTTTNTSYFAEINLNLNSDFLDLVVDDDANFIDFRPHLVLIESPAMAGRTLTLSGYSFYFDLNYDFNTTYLFNYFLSDQNYVSRSTFGSWSFTSTQKNYLVYVYTTAGNDEYYIYNSPSADIGTTRKKYAIDYNQEFFRGESVGAGFRTALTGSDTATFDGLSFSFVSYRYRYYYLNLSNIAQAIVTAPLINFTEEVCSGGFLDINVGCYVNNAIAYLVNDAPVIYDAFTLLNTGIELAAQTFGIIGAFSDDNVFGYLILVGFGFIAVKWFLKNDE
jgi:hypothetical protein